MKRLTVIAPLDTATGFGTDARERMKALVTAGHEIVVRPMSNDGQAPEWIKARCNGKNLPEGDTELIVGPPNLLPTPGRHSVFYTTFESTEPTPWAMKMLNHASAVIVPCAWNRESLITAGFTKPVRVCAQGIDPDVFFPRPEPHCDAFVFGAAGNSARGSAGRKGLQRVIDAFMLAFPTDAKIVLIVKDHPGSPLVCFDRRVEIVRETWPQGKLAEWYSSLDVFVNASHGEGWGRMVHEAMASGVPVITPKHGGVAEFFQDDCGWEIPWTQVPAENGWSGWWAQPIFQHIVEAMREARHKLERCEARGWSARQQALRFTWAKVNPQFIETLIELGAIERRAEHL